VVAVDFELLMEWSAVSSLEFLLGLKQEDYTITDVKRKEHAMIR